MNIKLMNRLKYLIISVITASFFIIPINLVSSFGEVVDLVYPEPPPPLPFKLKDPHNRPKNGPTLNNVTHKVHIDWMRKWIDNPKGHDPEARMPILRLEEKEIEAVIAYLASIADEEFPQVEWEPLSFKSGDEMTDEEWDEMDALYAEGKLIFSSSRCIICHRVDGEFGVVGVGPDLGAITIKINRNWLYQWLERPQGYFSGTQMSRFKLTDEQLRQVVEFVMRDDQFKPEVADYYGLTEEEYLEGDYTLPAELELLKKSQDEYATLRKNKELVEEGKRVIEVTRCFLCHKIEGFEEKNLLPQPETEDPMETETIATGENAEFAKLIDDIRCLTCHRMRGIGGHFAPDLTRAGSKLKVEWEIDFLQSPNPIRPLLKQMPRFKLLEEDAIAATNFIEKFLVSHEVPIMNIDEDELTDEQIEKGSAIFFEKGCQACHTAGEEAGAIGPGLNQAGTRLETGFIFFHIQDPQRANPGAVEPKYDLSEEELLDLTHFLMTFHE
ncbi:MAG: putative (tetraheme) protein [Candidatus Scalindua rubra]|uniref:Putative (Tetraheme) protein n=1 Tax=Candidatus Scalindua rubra TaxID=1872076 RepID=A0A1E3X7A5_9BACT|nr:MAG: putative (tetraheme) protein [Candidatus Scalindua rubra]